MIFILFGVSILLPKILESPICNYFGEGTITLPREIANRKKNSSPIFFYFFCLNLKFKNSTPPPQVPLEASRGHSR